jgi:hypothetical protein
MIDNHSQQVAGGTASDLPGAGNVSTGPKACKHCNTIHGARCPFVKVIEYYESGAVKRVEFIDARPIQQNARPPLYPRDWHDGLPGHWGHHIRD